MFTKKWRTGLLVLALSTGIAGCGTGNEKAIDPGEHTYANPVSLDGEWEQYGLGDPFVFSFNGYYYLYVSTRDTDTGVKVWRSKNLVDWEYKGLCTEEPETAAAYAPEVRYWNGKFYMYTSPAGQGHYVLTSDSPLGPFRLSTENFGRTIDGTTFVDDDGKWYFYYAGANGIQAASMTDPLTLAPEEVQTGAFMGGWTEGPTVFKHNGKYFMTYTGNHVFSSGYRVNAAVSDNPLQGFAGFEGNPVLLRSEGKTVGLGHNSVVTGPDLDTQYMFYHNLEGPGIVGPLRHMNMDRIVWNGDRFSVWGPTSSPQPAPLLPAFADYFDRSSLGGEWSAKGQGKWTIDAAKGMEGDSLGRQKDSVLLAKPETGAGYTAEFHVQVKEGEAAGAVFSYKDSKNFGEVLLDKKTGEITAKVYRAGTIGGQRKALLPQNFDAGKLQNLRIEVSGKQVRIFAATMRLLDLELQADVGGGKIGYVLNDAKAGFGYIAFSNFVDGSGIREAYAPIPGEIDAVDYANAGKHSDAKIETKDRGGYDALNLNSGAELSYQVNVEETGLYSIHFHILPASKEVSFRVTDEKGQQLASLKAEAGPDGEDWQTISAQGIKLEKGFHQLKVQMESGAMDFAWFKAAAYTPVKSASEEFDSKNPLGWTRYEGEWSIKEGQLRASSISPAKILYGDYGWSDYTVTADFTVPEAGGQTGILIRATDPANGMERNQNRDDFLRGYFIYLDDRGIHLAKHDYSTVPLADAGYDLPAAGQTFRLKVSARGPEISVYADSGSDPVLTYIDRSEQPFLQGKIGFKSVGTSSRFDRITVEK